MWPGGFPRYLAGAHGARLATTEADVDAHTEIFAAAADALLA